MSGIGDAVLSELLCASPTHDMVVAQGWASLRTISSRMCFGQI